MKDHEGGSQHGHSTYEVMIISYGGKDPHPTRGLTICEHELHNLKCKLRLELMYYEFKTLILLWDN